MNTKIMQKVWPGRIWPRAKSRKSLFIDERSSGPKDVTSTYILKSNLNPMKHRGSEMYLWATIGLEYDTAAMSFTRDIPLPRDKPTGLMIQILEDLFSVCFAID